MQSILKVRKNRRNNKKVLVLGGAGFIGSNISSYYLKKDWHVTIIDGLLETTGGRIENINKILPQVYFINSKIEDVHGLRNIIESNNLIIDCMAWTSHRSAIVDPLYDIELNVKSHVCFLKAMPDGYHYPIIYLGSRGQYGNPKTKKIVEETPMVPEDVQGIHKLAAEHYFRVFSRLKGFNVASVRFSNCFGVNQPFLGDDIGLIGSFIRDIINNRVVEVYGDNRKRSILYVDDLCKYIYQLGLIDFKGFNAYNLSGRQMSIEDIVRNLIEIIGKGDLVKKKIPDELKAIDIGNAFFNDQKIRHLVGKIPLTESQISLGETVNYFKKNMQ